MRRVDRALTKPSRCAVIPYIGIDHPEGYIDTGSEMPGKGDQWDNHIYVSIVALREMNRVMGWPTPEQATEQEIRIAQLETELAEVTERADKAETFLDAIDALESAGLRARRKTGRPKKEAVA